MMVFTPAKDYFLYRDKFVFRVLEPAGINIIDVVLSRGEVKDDPFFGKTEVFHRPVRAVIRIRRTSAAATKLTLHLRYQGYNEPLGVCYIPVEKNPRLALPMGQ